uniref:Uncharacterized protein n=1 Tax=Anguilla anguilla TaxID=7936 RepID=A0A0E9TIA8_ANGAN
MFKLLVSCINYKVSQFSHNIVSQPYILGGFAF